MSSDSGAFRLAKGDEPNTMVLPEGHLYRRAVTLGLLTVALLFALILGVIFLIREIYTPPSIVGVTGSGWTFSGKVSKYTTDEMMDNRLFDEVYESVWLRTEQGSLRDILTPFVADEILSKMDDLHKERRSRKESFRVSAVILDRRVFIKKWERVSLMYRTRVSVRVLQGADNASSEVYYNAVFVRVQPTDENPLGWYMKSLTQIHPDYFYADEAKIIEEKVFENSAPAQAPQGSKTP